MSIWTTRSAKSENPYNDAAEHHRNSPRCPLHPLPHRSHIDRAQTPNEIESTVSDASQDRGGDEPRLAVNRKSGEEAAPESDAHFKKCPACGKFTRDANMCRHCGHQLTPPQPSAKAKANFSPGERKVALSVTILAALTAVGSRSGLLPPLAILFSIFAGSVTGGVLCIVVWLRAQREGMAGGVKFGIYGIVMVTLLTIVAMQLLSGA